MIKLVNGGALRLKVLSAVAVPVAYCQRSTHWQTVASFPPSKVRPPAPLTYNQLTSQRMTSLLTLTQTLSVVFLFYCFIIWLCSSCCCCYSPASKPVNQFSEPVFLSVCVGLVCQRWQRTVKWPAEEPETSAETVIRLLLIYFSLCQVIVG